MQLRQYVSSHVLLDGNEKPISFASSSRTHSEKNYAQLKKEALSLVVGVKKLSWATHQFKEIPSHPHVHTTHARTHLSVKYW